jgi:hypothetical protein
MKNVGTNAIVEGWDSPRWAVGMKPMSQQRIPLTDCRKPSYSPEDAHFRVYDDAQHRNGLAAGEGDGRQSQWRVQRVSGD